MRKYTQLDLFDDAKPKRIYKRDKLGRFWDGKITNEEKLFRENNRLSAELETWKRKAESLTKLLGHKKML